MARGAGKKTENLSARKRAGEYVFQKDYPRKTSLWASVQGGRRVVIHKDFHIGFDKNHKIELATALFS